MNFISAIEIIWQFLRWEFWPWNNERIHACIKLHHTGCVWEILREYPGIKVTANRVNQPLLIEGDTYTDLVDVHGFCEGLKELKEGLRSRECNISEVSKSMHHGHLAKGICTQSWVVTHPHWKDSVYCKLKPFMAKIEPVIDTMENGDEILEFDCRKGTLNRVVRTLKNSPNIDVKAVARHKEKNMKVN